MEIPEAIQNFDDHRTKVSDDLLRDALDLYEAGLDMVVKNPPRNINDNIPGFYEFMLAESVINTYYSQNPGFDYNTIREGFTPEQMDTLQRIQGDRIRAQEKEKKRRGYEWD